MNDTSPTRKTLRWRPQFSLRVLLITLSLFAIGFPVWYRWPYQEIHEERDPTGFVTSKSVLHWQRQWGGDTLLHGKREDYQYWVFGKTLVTTTNYVRGKRHGPYTTRTEVRPNVTGQYVDDMREGKWTIESAWKKATLNYRRDKLDGTATIELLGQRKKQAEMTAVFDAGKLISFNGQPVQDDLSQVLESGAVDELTAAELRTTITEGVDFVETPLMDVIEYLKDKHNIPMIMDTKLVPKAEMPITAFCFGLDLASTLTLLTSPRGVACDYRYGCLWVTTAEDAKDWHDPTGVANVKPPKGSALDRAWNEPVSVDAVNVPLANVLAAIAQRLAIEIDTSQVQSTNKYLVTHQARGIAFHDMLGQLLYFTGCRCRLEGERLVILPPGENDTSP